MDIFQEIDRLTASEINAVVDAVLAKYQELFPDWEIATFSIFKKDDREDQIDRLIQLLKELKTSR